AFDELFFFAGASDDAIHRFQEEAWRQKARLRSRGALWSLAVGASTVACIRELSQLYQRSFHAPPLKIGIATTEEAAEIFAACDRCLLLAHRDSAAPAAAGKSKVLPLFSRETWPMALEGIVNRQLLTGLCPLAVPMQAWKDQGQCVATLSHRSRLALVLTWESGEKPHKRRVLSVLQQGLQLGTPIALSSLPHALSLRRPHGL